MKTTQYCDRCGAKQIIEWKCQLVCPNCGAKLDCSDLFVEHPSKDEKKS